MTTFTWQCSPFDELSTKEIYAILKARQLVFVVEQNCPFLDADDVDQQCLHLVGWQVRDSVNTLAAYARLVPPVYPGLTVRIGAQKYLERFYSGFGFVTVSPTYIEDGIPHVEMVRQGVMPAR